MSGDDVPIDPYSGRRALVDPEADLAAEVHACQGKRSGDVCYLGSVPNVCQARPEALRCFQTYPQELALAYSRTGSGSGWYALTAAGLLTLCVSLVVAGLAHARGRRGRWARSRLGRGTAMALGLLSVVGLVVLSLKYRPPLRPESLVIYPVDAASVPVGTCKRNSAEDTSWTSSWRWASQMPVAVRAENRDAILVAVHEGLGIQRHDSVIALDAENLLPLWSVGPCWGGGMLMPSGAAFSLRRSHLLTFNADGLVSQAWWVRDWPPAAHYDFSSRTLNIDVPWEIEEIRRVQIEIDLEDNEIRERLVGPPDSNERRRPNPERPSRLDAQGRFYLHGRIYQLTYDPVSIRRLDSDALAVAARFPTDLDPNLQ